MKYAEKILNSWIEFDSFLAKQKPEDKEYLSFVRNLYVANVELGSRSILIDTTLHFLGILYSIFNLFLRNPVLSNSSQIILFEINLTQDKRLEESANIPLSKILWKWNRSYKDYKVFNLFKNWLRFCFLLLFSSDLKIFPTFKSLRNFLNGLIIYEKIKISGIEKIITQRDRYPEEIGLLRKAKEFGLKTAKFDNFLALGTVNQNSIFCDYYLYPNKINADHFRKYDQNSNVKFIEVGFPYWDDIARFKWNPKKEIKIITFFSQYGYNLGIFGEKGPLFYVNELLNVMDDNFILYVKKHPLESDHYYKNLTSPSVRILKQGEYENGELFSISTFVFSLASQALIESKHINPQSAYINYCPEESLDWDYRLLNGKIDLIQSREELKHYLFEKKDFIPVQDFIASFNPSFPNSMEKIIKCIKEL